MIKSIIFDFDGVIVQSNEIREQIYYNILNHVPGSKEAMKEALTEDLKRNRYGIIEAALQKLKERGAMQFSDLKSETEKYVNMYNEITEREVSKVSEVPGANLALDILSKKYNLYILTGTLQRSIDIVLRNRKLKDYFKKVYGNYRYKVEGMKVLLQEQNIDPREVVYIGDGKEDYECAKEFGMQFIGIINERNNFRDNPRIKHKLLNLEGLTDIIINMNFNQP